MGTWGVKWGSGERVSVVLIGKRACYGKKLYQMPF